MGRPRAGSPPSVTATRLLQGWRARSPSAPTGSSEGSIVLRKESAAQTDAIHRTGRYAAAIRAAAMAGRTGKKRTKRRNQVGKHGGEHARHRDEEGDRQQPQAAALAELSEQRDQSAADRRA